MTNYNEMLKNTNTIKEIKSLVDDINADILDNVPMQFDFAKLQKAVAQVNTNNENDFATHFCYAVELDRKKAFAELLDSPCFDTYSIKANDDGTFEINDNVRLFKFQKLEKAYQVFKSVENDKNGKPIANKSATIFGALRFYGVMGAFIRNLQKSNFEIDGKNGYHLENVVLDNMKIFDEKDGECFTSNSNGKLTDQLNIIVKFFSYDVMMCRKDLPILKIKAQKIKQDKTSAKFSVNAIINDNNILDFANAVFGVVATRIKGEDIEIITKKADKE